MYNLRTACQFRYRPYKATYLCNTGLVLELIILELTNLSRSVSQDQAVSSLILLVATKIKAAEEIPSNHVLHSIADCKKVDDNIAIPTL